MFCRVVLCAVVSVVACSKGGARRIGAAPNTGGPIGTGAGPCPSGQELREVRNPKLLFRGCLEKDSEGNDRLQGKWTSFYASGKRQAEFTFKNLSSAEIRVPTTPAKSKLKKNGGIRWVAAS